VLFLLGHGVPASWIEQMDAESLVGWVWAGQLYDGFEWSDMLGHPVEKKR
jgi:hypothetical protein